MPSANRGVHRHQIKAKEKKLARIVAALEDQQTRSTAMHEHLKNVKQEVVYTQVLPSEATVLLYALGAVRRPQS
jgi:hypothetical protein